MAGRQPSIVASDTTNRTAEAKSIGRLCDVLSNARRRAVIGYLREQDDGAVPLETLVEHVATADADENDGVRAEPSSAKTSPPETAPPDAVAAERAEETLRAQLFHVDLPKLDDAGVVSYAREAGTVEYTGEETVEELLDAVE
jgi:hypothetical protein